MHGVYALLTSLGLVLMAGSLIVLARRLEGARQMAAVNERRYRSLFEHAPMAYQSLDHASRIVEVNTAWTRLFGFEAQEVIGQPISAFLDETALQSLACPNLEPAVFEITRKNGERRRIVAAGRERALAADGDDTGLQHVLRDVTDELAVAAELANEHALLRSLIDSVPDLIFFKDLNNVYLGCNHAFAQFCGRTEIEQIGRTDSQSFNPETAASFLQKDREMLALGTSCHHEEWVMYPDGRLVLLDTLRAPLLGAQGEPLGLIGISRDITERKSAEESLLLAQSVFESTNEAIMVTDTQARILMVNPAFVAITGWGAGDAIGRRPNLLRSGRHSSEFYAAMWGALEERGHWEGEICNRRKNGELYVEWMTINAIRDPDGAVSRYVALFSDITARKNQETEIWRQANFDALTGLANRNLFHDRLDRAMVSGRRNCQQVGLMFIDLDRFKSINDTLGHEVGDKLLIEAAVRLQCCVRDEDTVARMGGDEFTVVLQGLTDQEALQDVAVKILAALAQPFMLEGGPQHISASIGVTIFPADAENTSDLLRNADIAMYQAKAAGRNCYQFYSADMQEEALVRVELERDLRRAINGGELVLHYQPMVDAGSRVLVGAEALLRWQHPVRGLLPPSEFLSIAEDTHLIVSLGEWVIDEVCRQWRAWVDAGHAPIRISINISNVHFRDAGIGQCIAGALARHRVPGSMLSLDLNESVMFDSGQTPSRWVQELAVLGLHYSLDDFGTGYACLAALKWLPFDTVKIDRGFMPGLLTSEDDQHMVNAIVFMAHSHNLAVVAEGVETQAQLDFLGDLGCDFVQGYLIGSPMSAAEFGHFHVRQPAGNSKSTRLGACLLEC
jgi:diguanylate cyclase (GGDEF)-like protein/PAS domain S-box-containing protein